MDNYQTNDEGLVAIRHTRLVPIVVRNTPTRTEYLFSIRANITLAWIHPDDVQYVLGIMGGCCGQKNKKVFFPASEDDVRRWTNNGGR